MNILKGPGTPRHEKRNQLHRACVLFLAVMATTLVAGVRSAAAQVVEIGRAHV